MFRLVALLFNVVILNVKFCFIAKCFEVVGIMFGSDERDVLTGFYVSGRHACFIHFNDFFIWVSGCPDFQMKWHTPHSKQAYALDIAGNWTF